MTSSRTEFKFLVTGSARPDVYRRGGDSLQGRYHYYRLHPFSPAEIEGLPYRSSELAELPIGEVSFQDTLNTLDTFGGFPEPVTKQNKRQLRLWQNEKLERMFREDILDAQSIREIGTMKILRDILPLKERVTLDP